MAKQLVLAQDVAHHLWYEGFLEPGKTHLVVDSNLRNLSEVMRWARVHEQEVDAMIDAANDITETATSVEGIRLYLRELLQQYTSRTIEHAPTRHPRALRFSCTAHGSDEHRTCEMPHSLRIRQLKRVKCQFRVPGGLAFDTLHDAATAAGLNPVPASPPMSEEQPTKVKLRSLLCSIADRVNARANGSRWCYHFVSPESCHQHFVPGVSSSCARRPCVWTGVLSEGKSLGMAVNTCQPTRGLQERRACIALCCPDLCGNRTIDD